MNKLLQFLKRTIKKQSTSLTKLFNLNLLNKQQTEILLATKSNQVFHANKASILLPQIIDLTDAKKILFKEQLIDTGETSIWCHENKDRKSKQLRNGSIVVGNKVLDTGFGNSVVAVDLIKLSKRNLYHANLLIAPWSYYWTGYFDYIFFIALIISRIKNTLSPEEFTEAVLCYPLFGTSFELEIITLLGFKKENVLDSRSTSVAFQTCIIGNNDNWSYPNQENILLFKKFIDNAIPVIQQPTRRIYIQRAGRRKLINENELIPLFMQYGIEIIEDSPKTFTEQVLLYRSASFIIGPHGASFANILWCQPGATLLELFPNTYMPDYFRYLSTILQLNYSAYCHGEPLGSDHAHVNEDVFVDTSELARYLSQLLP